MQVIMTDTKIPADAEADVNDLATPTSQGEESAKPDTGVDATDSADASRESLIQSLLQKPVDETEDKEEEVEEVTEADDEDEEDSSPVADTPPADADVAPVDPDVLLADKRLGERTKKTIQKLKQTAAFGDLLTRTAADAKISPEEFSQWVGLAARLKKGDVTAVDELVATAKTFGYTEPKAAPSVRVKSVDDIARDIYEAEFKADVDDLQIGESVAKKQSRRLAELQMKAEPAEPEPEKQRTVQPPQQQRMDPVREHALRTIDQMESEYVSKIKDYSKIKESVNKRLADEYGKADPIMWVSGYQNIVREEVRKAAPVQSKPSIKPVAGVSVRSSSSPAPKPAAGTDAREDLVKALLSGQFSKR